jgi:hypothetical protein
MTQEAAHTPRAPRSAPDILPSKLWTISGKEEEAPSQ